MTTNDLDLSKNSETAANAAVVAHQLVDERAPSNEGAIDENLSNPQTGGARVVFHPVWLLYDDAFAETLPSVTRLAAFKNIELLPGEDSQVAHYALRAYSGRALRRVTRRESKALHQLMLDIDHALDVAGQVLMTMAACFARGVNPPPLTELAERIQQDMAKRANDRIPFTKWPNIDAALIEFERHNKKSKPVLSPVKLAAGAATTIKMPTTPWKVDQLMTPPSLPTLPEDVT